MALGVGESGMTQDLAERLDGPRIGEELYALAAELYPICRSITGPGVRETLGMLQMRVPLEVRAVASGTPVLDWTVPKEWSIRDAYIKNAAGERVVDFRAHALHVMSYSTPVRATMPLSSLKKHIHTLPGQPDLIPYRTSYYNENWAFCMSQNALNALPDGDYEVLIDSELKDGVLNYGEYVHPGESADEVLLSAHVCHPQLANDNCSGIALLTLLAARMQGVKTRYTYRYLWAPGTIGAITWLAQNEANAHRIKHGLVLSCVGDAGGPTYKRTRRGDAQVDRAMAHVLTLSAAKPNIIDFFPYGYDERQYNSPGFLLDVGLFQRSQFATFPEYHTSGDDLSFIAPAYLARSYRDLIAAIDVLERDGVYLNLAPKGEPQLGVRGLYSAIGGNPDSYAQSLAMLWVLNLSDGKHTLLDIAERAKTPFATIANLAALLQEKGLLAKA